MAERFSHVTCFAKVFLLLIFFSLNIKIFIIKSCFMTHIKWNVISSPSLRSLLKVWIWFSWQNRKFYPHDGEQLGFYKKVQFKTQSKKKYLLVIFILQKTNNSNLLEKNVLNRTSNSIFKMKKVDLDES